MTSQSQEVGDLEIIVSHGPDKHCVSLPGAATVGDLSLKLEELTAVPVGGQKIINRGKTLMNHDLNVTEAGIRNGSKLMLIGKKGYLHKELESNSLSSLGKRLAACHEEYVRLLEKLDALDLGVCNQSIRMKRRSVIKEIQSQLDTNDSISTTIDKLQNTSDS
ncbi:uncharacterized protein LOC115925366 isoform X2 [Strongylocentrotus purpuratus]|uniref:BAG family molecular chaperone regulator 1 n=1 Tax=Strongylocentrotus purpuratus TaxID=7668 RepID=A0A7M7P477_STRPU|nr:uncharacterized protein LOC579477 isoform X2 [Strongylocentrotus purpuratus]XP_030844917.1 uncharacterized protein LOC115925366 isoform X2 [Strongylocentrotus purpuratus]